MMGYNKKIGYEKREKRLIVLAIVFLVAAFVFMCYQISVMPPEASSFFGISPATIDNQAISAKGALEKIGTEIENIAKLL